MRSFELHLTAEPADIDGLGHVNNVVYLRWAQDVAAAHWQAATTAALRAEVAWVVTRHEIDYKAPAFAGDRIEARTWVGDATGATWPRHIEFRRDADRCLLATVRSVWAALDAKTGRPRRIDTVIRSAFEAV
jgi:acyl-CoA thioester hydrolase